MRKLPRILAAAALLATVLLLTLPAETRPKTGRWLERAHLEARTLRVGRMDLRYVRTGQGPTVILVHGLASSIFTWADVVQPLSRNFDVVALDLPGFGESSQPADLSFEDFEPAIVGLMDALSLSRAHFVGNSMGGAISLLMAARHPDRVDRVVLLDSAGFNFADRDRPFMVRVMGSPAAGSLASHLPVKRVLARFTLGRLLEDDSRLTSERVDEYVAPLLREGALASMQSLLRSRFDGPAILDLSRVRAPTLVLWGRHDPWLPEAHADRFVAALPGARKVMLETGHMPQEERPDEVARLIGEFLIS